MRRTVGWVVPMLGLVLALHALADSTGTAAPDSARVKPDSAKTAAPDSARIKSDPAITKRASHGNASLGKKIFEVKCVACHRADGSGGVKVTITPTPNWRDPRRMSDPRYDDAYLRDCITNGKPKSGMVAWSRQGMKPAEIENLIAYVRTFSATKTK